MPLPPQPLHHSSLPQSTPQETALRISELKAQLARCAKELGNQLNNNNSSHRSRQNSVRRRDAATAAASAAKPPSGRSVSVDRGYLTKASLITTGASYTTSPTSPQPPPGYCNNHTADSARQGYFLSGSVRGGTGHNMTSHQIPIRLIGAQQNYNGHLVSPLTSSAVATTTAIHSHNSNNNNNLDTRSFIQERIERLYGPQALAAGFIRRSPTQTDGGNMGNTVKRTSSNRTEAPRVIPIQLEYTQEELEQQQTTEGGLPSVFRHLRPEFRHQLPVKSPVSSTAKCITDNNSSSNTTTESNNITNSQQQQRHNEVDNDNISSSASSNGGVVVMESHHKQQKQPDDDTSRKTSTNGSSGTMSDQPIKLNGSTGKVWDSLPEVSARVVPDERSDAIITTTTTTSSGGSCDSSHNGGGVATATAQGGSVKAGTQLKDGHYFLQVRLGCADTM